MTKQEEITEVQYELQWLEAEIELACLKWELAKIYGAWSDNGN